MVDHWQNGCLLASKTGYYSHELMQMSSRIWTLLACKAHELNASMRYFSCTSQVLLHQISSMSLEHSQSIGVGL